ncbi:MAG: hypothetical protein JRG91_02780 [Deltaproteobacteria bacterium]|nr:hypothetical protein [Deltaproteobacteria bacterium]
MLLRGITITTAAAFVSCASATPRGAETAESGSLVLGVRNSLSAGHGVHAIRLSLEGEQIASLEAYGSGEDWTQAIETGETRVFSHPVPGGAHVSLEVWALIGKEQVKQVLELEVPARAVAVLVTMLIEDGHPAIRIEKVALSELEGEQRCIEHRLEPAVPQPAC